MSFKVDLNETETKAEEDRKWLRCPNCGSEHIRMMSATYGNTYVCCVRCGNEGTTKKFEPRRRTYTVRWEIEVDANSALEAAKEAESIQRCQVDRYDEEGEPVKAGVFDVRLFGRAPDQWDEMRWDERRVDLDTESVVRRVKL